MAALTGNYRAEHRFALKQNFTADEFLLPQLAECATAIEALLTTLAARQPPPSAPLPLRAASGVPSTRLPATSAAHCSGSPAAPT